MSFSLVEMLVATLITLSVTGAALGLVQPVQAAFHAQLESGDVNQRLRAAVEVLTRDLLAAGAGLPAGAPPLTVPASGDGVTVRFVPWGAQSPVAHTYYLSIDSAAGTYELRRDDGEGSDVPVVDHVTALELTYDDGSGLALTPSAPDDVRRVRVRLRVQTVPPSLRMRSGGLLQVPDQEAVFDVAPRNLAPPD